MNKIFAFCLLIIVVISTANSQDWVNDWIAKCHSLNLKPDSMVTLLRQEFHKSIGTPAPTISFHRIDDDKIDSLVSFLGKVVLVNFWTTHCSGCRYEMPALSHLHDSLSEKGFQVIF